VVNGCGAAIGAAGRIIVMVGHRASAGGARCAADRSANRATDDSSSNCSPSATNGRASLTGGGETGRCYESKERDQSQSGVHGCISWTL
jgi:hypothetical protein